MERGGRGSRRRATGERLFRIILLYDDQSPMPRQTRKLRLVVTGVIASLPIFLQVSCLHHTVDTEARKPASSPSPVDFVDLQPGWKLRVVVPMLRSGGYILPSLKQEANGNTIETGEDFLGYEQAYYRIMPRRNGGIRIRFSHAEVWEAGKTHTRPKPILQLFGQAASARHVRLVYLVRESKADHNMAILSSNDVSALGELTRALTDHAECRSSQNADCR